MENRDNNIREMEVDSQDTDPPVESYNIADSTSGMNDDSSNLFPESPVYEPEQEIEQTTETTIQKDEDIICLSEESPITISSDSKDNPPTVQAKRKLVDEPIENSPKMQKLDLPSTQTSDDEVSDITTISKQKLKDSTPTTSRIRTPVKSSPRKITKRSNSTDVAKSKTPKTAKSRSVSPNLNSNRTPRTPRKKQLKEINESSEKSRNVYNPIVEVAKKIPESIEEEISFDEQNDSQNLHLVLSLDDDSLEEKSDDLKKHRVYSSDPVAVKDRKDIVEVGKIREPQSEGYHYSDPNCNLSQTKHKDYKDKSTDQESTDSVCSMSLESPENIPNVACKLIGKLSNGNSSTPTDLIEGKRSDDSDSTPDMTRLNLNKGKRGKNESFRISNTTTPSTISPLQNGHSLPVNTPQIPVFDVHMSHNEDGEFLSLYIVRTDNDLGIEMCREYQRLSKRFTIDPYLADVSVSNSPSSVTSGGMISLPNRTSFASTVSSTSTSSSNRTSDGAFVVPQPPRKSMSNPTTSIKGYDALMKKIHDIFAHIRESSIDEGNKSTSEEKVSIGIQASPSSECTISNGNASPEEVGKCDKTTPKSSLKKTLKRGRRPLAGKTKRAILPTQAEEPEWQGMNSPEMVPMNGDGKRSPVKSPTEEKPLASLVGTPKSVSKLKQKRRPTSPRPATPVEKTPIKQEYSGYAPDTVVLAKWVDKRYYSGKVIEITEPNKYLIKFDDGQSKVLIDDFIIFGDYKTLPLQGQSVYAMVDEEQTYEPGLVLGVEENDSGTVTYRCTTDGDTVVMVTATELYLTEDQARSLKESSRAHSPAPSTPRRRHNRELDLDNIIQGPRSARSRDKAANSSARKRVNSPKSPKASTSGVKTATKATPARKRLASESSEISESSNSAPPVRLEEVAGVEPEVQRTPRKFDGVIKAGPLQLKGAAKQTTGKKNSKLNKFENDEQTVSELGPIPPSDSKNRIFAGLHFLLTCTDTPKRKDKEKKEATSTQCPDSRHYSSEEDGETSGMAGTDTEDLEFSDRPFNKERLKEQLEAGGGTVYSCHDRVPKNKYSVCKLIAPRPCTTAKYIKCLSTDIRAVSHVWVIMCCARARLLDVEPYALPAGWSYLRDNFVNWVPPSGRRNTSFFKDKTILVCFGDQGTVDFWRTVCNFVGATTRVVNEENLDMSGALALVTEWDCPHEVQNIANQENVPLVSTNWVIQCIIEERIVSPTSHVKFSFLYAEPE